MWLCTFVCMRLCLCIYLRCINKFHYHLFTDVSFSSSFRQFQSVSKAFITVISVCSEARNSDNILIQYISALLTYPPHPPHPSDVSAGGAASHCYRVTSHPVHMQAAEQNGNENSTRLLTTNLCNMHVHYCINRGCDIGQHQTLARVCAHIGCVCGITHFHTQD